MKKSVIIIIFLLLGISLFTGCYDQYDLNIPENQEDVNDLPDEEMVIEYIPYGEIDYEIEEGDKLGQLFFEINEDNIFDILDYPNYTPNKYFSKGEELEDCDDLDLRYEHREGKYQTLVVDYPRSQCHFDKKVANILLNVDDCSVPFDNNVGVIVISRISFQCVTQKAVPENNYQICYSLWDQLRSSAAEGRDSIEQRSSSEECVFEVAKASNSAYLCDFLIENLGEPDYRGQCFEYYARELNDPSICNRIGELYYIDSCLGYFD